MCKPMPMCDFTSGVSYIFPDFGMKLKYDELEQYLLLQIDATMLKSREGFVKEY